jgi:hypothetical protein
MLAHHYRPSVDGPSFEHADGTPYGQAPSPRAVAVLEQVLRGLRGLGFKEREARRALDAATEELSTQGASPARRTSCGRALSARSSRRTSVKGRDDSAFELS